MNGITVWMAIVDFIPVILFFAASVYLQRDLYNKMVKGAYALLASGSLMVLLSGFFKALWKILYALNICDYQMLSMSFFTFQAPGFLFVFLALLGMYTKYNKIKKQDKLNVFLGTGVVPLFESSMPFVVIQVIGCAGMQVMLFLTSLRMKKKLPCILFVVAFVFMLGMGYLSAKFDDSSNMHWIAQVTNIVSQGALFTGVFLLHKSGLADADIFDK